MIFLTQKLESFCITHSMGKSLQILRRMVKNYCFINKNIFGYQYFEIQYSNCE